MSEPRFIRQKSTVICDPKEKRTKQSEAASCDINLLVKQSRKTGQEITHISNAMPNYGDFSNVLDYQSALNLANLAQSEFLKLPPELRAKFENDPGNYLDFISDPANAEESIEQGSIDKDEPAEERVHQPDERPLEPVSEGSKNP